jgi:hypothetical protein
MKLEVLFYCREVKLFKRQWKVCRFVTSGSECYRTDKMKNGDTRENLRSFTITDKTAFYTNKNESNI